MKFFWKFIFPPLFGLLIYATVRVLNDTISRFKFWERNWTINTIEIISSMLMGYIINYALRLLFKKFDTELQQVFSYKKVLQELLWVFLIIELCTNAVFTPMAALTDDGLSWGDVAAINIIPALYCLIYYAVARSNRILQAYVNNKLLLEKVTNDHLQTELKFLKAQYHPHFLFNALNNIYFQMDENVQEAKKTIEKFSELLRYQLYDQQKTVPIGQEIDYLNNFIALQRVRMPEKINLHVSIDKKLNGEQIYPLLFLPLVENAFKYAGGDYRILISLVKKDKGVELRVENSVARASTCFAQGGIGIENLKRRLELLYPERHALKTTISQQTFLAELELKF